MSLQKTPPYRSKAFLKFCHEETEIVLCCICCRAYWSELHHFGDDGGGAMKPSDNEVGRTCVTCHDRYDFKRIAFFKKGTKEYLIVLEQLQNDALKLNRAYIEKLEEK